MQVYKHSTSFPLESGATLQELEIAYDSWGELNENRDNVIWICHALTANSNAKEWWPGLVGEGLAFDTEKYFVICANILGSCYGTTGPASTDPIKQKPYYHHFPFITIRDMVNAHQLLCEHLGIKKIQLLAGGSMGGYQALEWSLVHPNFISQLFLLATSPKESAWGIGIHTAQRKAIELDPSWKDETSFAGAEGLKVARAIGMITYRSYESFVSMQTDDDNNKLDDFKASSYIQYQGAKLANRFSSYSYWTLTKAMDSHNIGRGRENVAAALKSIQARTLIIGIQSDILCPLQEQKLLAEHILHATFVAIESIYGHDGFLVETQAISHHLSAWLK
ncbi:MAG: homoserine O-acetyltransferase [Chitinophagaceae bacterium]|nr:MAG: homoserine O-acetyltransferase [Chitinophagaceae bacterium]